MGRKFSKKGKKLLLQRVLPLSVILLGCTGWAYGVNAEQYTHKFLPGTVINGIDVSDLTLNEAEADIRDQAEDYVLKLNFRGGNEETLDAEDMNLVYDCRKELVGILSSQENYSWLLRRFGEGDEYTLKTQYSYGDKELEESIKALPELQEGNYIEPHDAELNFEESLVFTKIPEIEGTEVLPEKLAEKAGEAIVAGKTELDLNELNEVYKEPEIRTESQVLIDRMTALNNLLAANVTLKMSDGTTRVIDKQVTKNWISSKNNLYVVDPEFVRANVAAFVADAALYDDDYGQFRAFMSTNYGMQKFETENMHGHSLDQETLTNKITEKVLAGQKAEVAPIYLHYADNQDPRFGGTYVEVDIYSQKVYFYQNYERIFECNCVSGTEGYRSTPGGIYSIEEKERGRVLNGYRDDGSLAYSSYVSYWMCFRPHYGLHDASWRDEFGGDIYEEDGSHGCVNLPTSAAATLYDLVDYGTPVIVFRGETQAV